MHFYKQPHLALLTAHVWFSAHLSGEQPMSIRAEEERHEFLITEVRLNNQCI